MEGLAYTTTATQRNANMTDTARNTVHRTYTETHGITERQVQEVINITRVLLSRAGLPASFSPYAMRAWRFGHSTNDVGKQPSPYELRQNKNFTGPRIPFGSLVYFKQSPLKEVNNATNGVETVQAKVQ